MASTWCRVHSTYEHKTNTSIVTKITFIVSCLMGQRDNVRRPSLSKRMLNFVLVAQYMRADSPGFPRSRSLVEASPPWALGIPLDQASWAKRRVLRAHVSWDVAAVAIRSPQRPCETVCLSPARLEPHAVARAGKALAPDVDPRAIQSLSAMRTQQLVEW